jgi:hypothetical protein
VPHRLNAFFASSSELSQLTSKARELMALQQQLEHIIPSSLSRGCRVMQLEKQKLTLSANNGATASKLRQMSAELITKFNDIGCKVTLIQIVVQVNPPLYSTPVKSRTLSSSGQKQLTQLADGIAESPLKDALNRLANRK